MAIQTYNFPYHKSGDTFNGVQFTLSINGVAKDLTGATISMSLDQSEFSTANGKIQITDPEAGIFIIKPQIITAFQRLYTTGIKFTFADGSIKTYIKATWTIL